MMKSKSLFLIIFLVFTVSGCSAYYPDMSGTVVDAETGTPIEGAVVLVEWTKRVGLGDYHTESVKVVEVVTDKDGKFTASGLINLFVDPPDVTVYKKGYVAWNNKSIFLGYGKREDFRWISGIVIKMEHFYENKYSYRDHVAFIHNSMHSGGPKGEKKLMESAIRWEELMSVKETFHNK